MAYAVILSKKFQKEFNSLSQNLQKIAKKKLWILETRLIGEPLLGDLKGFYSIHFHRNKYRIIYHKEDMKIEVLAVHIGKRTNNFYKNFKQMMRKK